MPADAILVAHQPAYLPWPGYFSRVIDVGRLVLLDHVQFRERGWQNRNYVRGTPGGKVRLTVPVRHSFGQPINDVLVADDRWRARHWRTLCQSYSKAPYWRLFSLDLEQVYSRHWYKLAELNEALLRLVFDAIRIEVELTRSSSIAPVGSKTDMLVDLCQRTGCRVLRVGTGAESYLDISKLDDAGIEVQTATYDYGAGGSAIGRLVPGLSMLDLLLYHGPHAVDLLTAGARNTSRTRAATAAERAT